MLTLIDRLLDRVTMYRLALYYLIALLAAAFVAAFLGLLPYQVTALALSTLLTLAVCWLANLAFAWAYRIPPNKESVYITALILVLIMEPVDYTDAATIGAVVFASLWAMASKYMLAIGRRHLFNPAALGVALAAIVLGQPASWWVGGNLALLPIVLVGGLLMVRKLRRWDLVGTFMAVVAATMAATTTPDQYGPALLQLAEYTPFLFFAFVMITEPLTMPAGRVRRLLFAALVGVLFSPAIHYGAVIVTPEQALLAGNLLGFLSNPKARALLRLRTIRTAASGVYDFVFSPEGRLAFAAGQYVEITLPNWHSDSRGNRRYFTIASAPTENDVVLGVKFYAAPSTFKQALARLRPGHGLLASLPDGGFTLPWRKDRKLAFLAGGVGVTPFRSMIHQLLDGAESRPIIMLYANEKAADIAYADVFERAERELGIRTVYTLAAEENLPPGMLPGLIDRRLIQTEIPDYDRRTFYISGPRRMVAACQELLRGMGVPRRRIKVDFFPGFG